MEPDIPLVVPEVNPQAIADFTKRGIIANPNCSTIQMVIDSQTLRRGQIKRVVVSTYQAVSGTGSKAIEELDRQSRAVLGGTSFREGIRPYDRLSCLPHIDSFSDNRYTKEEIKMVNETKKIVGDTCRNRNQCAGSRFLFHSESVNIETEKKLTPEQARKS
jgi:aspartate-semialdehyde dehydrogenase